MLHIIGNLTADPETRTVQGPNGPATVCHITVAANHWTSRGKTTWFFQVSLWNRMAENAMKYLSKGSKVAVSGPVAGRAYIARDGQARLELEIDQVKEIEYLSSRTDAPTVAGNDGFTEVTDDELPF